MKKQDLIRHLKSHGCNLLRDKGKHSIYVNPVNNRTSSVPRKREINPFLARKTCRDLGIPEV
jgi:predicted RNA binding protein YcfA (HicA-like mRNA interferase family)